MSICSYFVSVSETLYNNWRPSKLDSGYRSYMNIIKTTSSYSARPSDHYMALKLSKYEHFHRWKIPASSEIVRKCLSHKCVRVMTRTWSKHQVPERQGDLVCHATLSATLSELVRGERCPLHTLRVIVWAKHRSSNELDTVRSQKKKKKKKKR